MRAVIVAAGRGSRMGALTESRPKCLIPFAGRTLLEWQLASLRSAGVDDICIVGGYRSEALAAFDLPVVMNVDWNSTNMVHSLLCARSFLESADEVIVAYSDIVYEPRVSRAVADASSDVAVAVDLSWRKLWEARFDDPLDDAESLRLGAGGRILQIGQKAASIEEIEGQYMGLMKLTTCGVASLLALCDAPEASGLAIDSCYMTDVLQVLAATRGNVYAATVEGGWLEFDEESDFRLYEELLAQGELEGLFAAGSGN